MVDIKKQVRKNILELKPYSSARKEYNKKIGTFLDANENPFGRYNRYPDPNQTDLKSMLADLKKVDTDNIFIGNGSDELIDLALRIFCTPKEDLVLSFQPSYGMYKVSCQINDNRLVEIPLDSSFMIDLETTIPYLEQRKAKVCILCSPNNPTGNSLEQEKIEYIIQHFDGIVIIDEAYGEFSQKPSLLPLIKEYNNVIVSQTFSKAWGLAGIRVGVAYANQEIIQFFNHVKPPYNVSTPNQAAAIQALAQAQKFKENLTILLDEKERVTIALRELTCAKKVYPSDANFLLVQFDDADEVYKKLIAQNIITRNRHQQVNNCLRITIGTPRENDLLINALKSM